MIPNSLKEIDSLEVFKRAIKKWETENCPCQKRRFFITLNLKETIIFENKRQHNILIKNLDISIDYAVCYSIIDILLK